MKVKQKIKEEPNLEGGQLEVEDIKQENEVGHRVTAQTHPFWVIHSTGLAACMNDSLLVSKLGSKGCPTKLSIMKQLYSL